MLIAENTSMKGVTFPAEIARHERLSADIDPKYDLRLWRDAADVFGRWEYASDGEVVRLREDWTPLQRGDSIVPISIEVAGERGAHYPPLVERFFHDAFLLFNIAVPGAFGGVLSTTGGEYRVNELTFDASLFEYAWVRALRAGSPSIEALPLADVIAWYSALGIGTRDVAGSAIEKALFHLLWIARSSGDDWTTRLRLALCLDALGLEDEELRRALDVRDASVLHPLHDVDEPDAVDAIDRAAALVVSAIQANVR